jgi:hypothetical protein
MSEFYPAIIEEQKTFSTGTAPALGRVNISPKGMDTFRTLGPNTVNALIVAWKENGSEIVKQLPKRVAPIARGKYLRTLEAYVVTGTAP